MVERAGAVACERGFLSDVVFCDGQWNGLKRQTFLDFRFRKIAKTDSAGLLIRPGEVRRPSWPAALMMGESVGPIGARAAGGVLSVDGGIDLAAEEEGETPVEGVGGGVGTGKTVGYTDGGVHDEGVGVGYGESERATGAVCSLIRGAGSLRGGRAVEEGQIGAGGESCGSGVQKKDGVRTGVQESAEGVVVESGGD